MDKNKCPFLKNGFGLLKIDSTFFFSIRLPYLMEGWAHHYGVVYENGG